MIADHLLAENSGLSVHTYQVCQCKMAVTRNALRNAVTGALVTLWGVTRHRGKRYEDDLILRNASLSVCDDITELPGFGAALESVGWVRIDGKNLVFPRFFEEFNSEPSVEKRKNNAERQRRFREKQKGGGNALCNALCNGREEKRREEYTHTHTPDGFELEWKRWCGYVETTAGRRNAIQEETWLLDLLRRGPEKARRDIEFSIAKGAKSLLDSDNDFSQRGTGRNGRGALKTLDEVLPS